MGIMGTLLLHPCWGGRGGPRVEPRVGFLSSVLIVVSVLGKYDITSGWVVIYIADIRLGSGSQLEQFI